MKIDCVFSGGGIKGFAFIGALQSIEENNLQIERVAGVSAGAMISALIASGYTSNEIHQMALKLDTNEFLDRPLLSKIFPFAKWYFLYEQLGMYKGDRLEEWVFEQLADKNIYTFKDLPKNSLKMIVSDVTLEKMIVIPDDLERVYGIDPDHFSIAEAVRMSASFPYFFMPKKLKTKSKDRSIIVDGGLLSNFPVWLYQTPNKTLKRPVLGVHITSGLEENKQRTIKNALSMLHALFSTMKVAHDNRYISLSKDHNIISIPVEHVQTMNLSITEEAKKELLEKGYQSANDFLKYWPK